MRSRFERAGTKWIVVAFASLALVGACAPDGGQATGKGGAGGSTGRIVIP